MRAIVTSALVYTDKLYLSFFMGKRSLLISYSACGEEGQEITLNTLTTCT